MIRIALRLDDPSPSSDHALERQLLGVLESLRIPLTAAVIPIGKEGLRVAADNVPHLHAAHAAGLLEVAQHGLSHDPLSTSLTGIPSEFADLGEEEQRRRVRTGRELLEQVFQARITGFVPPWNTLDANTVVVLAEEGYSYVSISSETRLWRLPAALRIQPHTCNIRQLEAAYMHAKRRPNADIAIIAILHHYDFYDFYGSEKTRAVSMESLAGTLSWLAEDPQVEFTTLGGIAGGMTIQQCWKAYQRRCRIVRMHWRLRQLFPRYQLLTQPLWHYLITRDGHVES